MRVITGAARGRRLKTLEGLETRPTAERVKEAVFSAIQFETEGRRVLDIFAGSGQMGIEALSRGARSAVFVDSGRDAVSIIKDNLQTTGLDASATVLCAEAAAYLNSCTETFDLIFFDPPYSKQIPQQILPLLSERLSDYGVVVCEHDWSDEIPAVAGALSAVRTRKYGRMGITYFRKEKPNHE